MEDLTTRIQYKWEAGTKCPLLLATPGAGKSSFVMAMAEKMGVKCRVINLASFEEVDMNGIPYVDPKTSKLTISDPYWLEGLEDGDIVFFDEVNLACLTKNHMVLMADGTHKDVSEIKPGDVVMSVGSNGIEPKEVEKIYSKVVDKLYVCYNEGNALTISSADHLHYTDKGYKRVDELQEGDYIYAKESELGLAKTMQLLRESSNNIDGNTEGTDTKSGYSILQHEMRASEYGRAKSQESSGQASVRDLQDMRDEVQMGTRQDTMRGHRMQEGIVQTTARRENANDEADTRDESKKEQHNAQKVRDISANMGEGQKQSTLKRWEWSLQHTTDNATTSARTRMGDGATDTNATTRPQLQNEGSQSLQSRHRESTLYGGDRTGRTLAQQSDSTRKGLEKTEGVRRIRVDSVKVLERKDYERFGYDGRVYCFDVKDNHNFIANGIVTHNCSGVRNALQTFILSGLLPSGKKAPRLRIIGAMNVAEDLDSVTEFSNAMKDRWAFIHFKFPVDEWHTLYKDNFGKPQTERERSVRASLSKFLTTNPQLLEHRKPVKASSFGITDTYEATAVEAATPNRRNWDNLARELAQTKDDEELKRMRKQMFIENVGMECWRNYKEYIATENKPLSTYKWDGEPDEISQQVNRLRAETNVDKQVEYFVRAYEYCKQKEILASLLPDILKHAISKYGLEYRTKLPKFYEVYQKIGA